MAVLSANRETERREAGLKALLMGTDIIYKGSMATVGVDGLAVAGQATVGHKFAGIASDKVDDSAGAGTKWCPVYTEGVFLMAATSITQAMVGQMMYLADDNHFDDAPASIAIPCGILVEYVSATEGYLDIGPAVALAQGEMSNAVEFVTKTDNYTCTVKDSGTRFAIATDAKAFTLPVTVKGLTYEFWNTGADVHNIITISPNAADRIGGGALGTGVDNKDLINTKASAKYGDMVRLVGDGADGWIIVELIGIWAKE